MHGEVRRSQLITTYGVGAIVAVEDESFMVAGIDRWPTRPPDLHEPRLQRALGVSGFVLPPADNTGCEIPVVRFPRWMWCPVCKTIAEHCHFGPLHSNTCNRCGVRLVPSRFVICCVRGHITDFPYFAWAHKGRGHPQGAHRLAMEMGGETASLADIRLSCSCGASATMEGAFGKGAMVGIAKCMGWRPWLTADEQGCDQLPRTLQRGASNVWFSIVQSAISIPPWSEGAFKILNRHWSVIQHVPDDALAAVLEAMQIAVGTPYTTSDLVEAVRQRKVEGRATELPTKERIKVQEYEALCKGRSELSKDQEFVAVPPTRLTAFAAKWFQQVMLVKRLREVRALSSFARVTPPGASGVFARPQLFETNPGWLPAIEVIGEGVFLRPKQERLELWETRDDVMERARRLDGKYAEHCALRQQTPDRRITPRFLLLHSLAHALMNEWALDSGYPAAALRERLYAGDSMAGILIYTATSDSAGSLGGIVSKAEADYLDDSLRQTIDASTWCSADPLCIEADGAGVDSLNLAACHACLLLPEVSCEEMNLLLDRAMLVGVPGNIGLGFFGDLIRGE